MISIVLNLYFVGHLVLAQFVYLVPSWLFYRIVSKNMTEKPYNYMSPIITICIWPETLAKYFLRKWLKDNTPLPPSMKIMKRKTP